MKSLSDFLKEFENVMEMASKDIHDLLDVNQKTYSALRTGRHKETGVNFHRKFELLLGIDIYRSLQEGVFYITDLRKLPYYRFQRLLRRNAITNDVPVFDINVSAGIKEIYRDDVSVMPKYKVEKVRYRGSDFGMRVQGDSMEPDIRDGDYVMCQEKETIFMDIISGQNYLFSTKDGLSTVKEAGIKTAAEIELVPKNPAHNKITIKAEDLLYVSKVTAIVPKEDIENND